MLLAMTHGVDWPRTPVDRLQDFRPAFCPRKDCRHHTQPDGFRCRKHGSYGTARGVEVPRYRCMGCGSTFSRRAFSLIYYRKRPELLRPVAAGLQAGSAHRQLARTLGCAPSTVTRISARLGRHALLLLRRALAALEGQLDEPVVLDHFETFELTQDLPFGVATPVGARSWFVYGIDPAPHARTGRRSPKQERRRKRRARRPKRGGYGGSATRVFECLLPLCPSGRPLQLIGDGHPAYDQAVRQHRRADHSLAAHKRETIAFGRRLNAIVERLFLVAIWRNFVKGVSERRNDSTTPAMRLGLTDRPWKWERVLGRRLFPDREKLAGIWLELYRRDWTTPELPCNTRHRRVFAY
jgi:transposase-like protein